jgi:hypothetical protein
VPALTLHLGSGDSFNPKACCKLSEIKVLLQKNVGNLGCMVGVSENIFFIEINHRRGWKILLSINV